MGETLLRASLTGVSGSIWMTLFAAVLWTAVMWQRSEVYWLNGGYLEFVQGWLCVFLFRNDFQVGSPTWSSWVLVALLDVGSLALLGLAIQDHWGEGGNIEWELRYCIIPCWVAVVTAWKRCYSHLKSRIKHNYLSDNWSLSISQENLQDFLLLS